MAGWYLSPVDGAWDSPGGQPQEGCPCAAALFRLLNLVSQHPLSPCSSSTYDGQIRQWIKQDVIHGEIAGGWG